MKSACKLVVLILAVASPVVPAQTPVAPTAKPIVFDTVSVKPNKSHDAHPGSMFRPDGFDAENTAPIWVLCWAFGQTAHDESCLSGVPGWVSSERFDIIAKVAGPDVPVWQHMSDLEKQRMIRDIFFDRFKMKTHVDTHEQPVYALIVAKGGAKLTLAKAAASGVSDPPKHGWFGFTHTGIVAGSMTMEEFAAQLTTLGLGKPVQDHTGLTGRYDFKLDFAPVASAAAPSNESTASAPDERPDIFTAFQEQLGLKLEPARGPVPVLVIDHIEMPSEN